MKLSPTETVSSCDDRQIRGPSLKSDGEPVSYPLSFFLSFFLLPFFFFFFFFFSHSFLEYSIGLESNARNEKKTGLPPVFVPTAQQPVICRDCACAFFALRSSDQSYIRLSRLNFVHDRKSKTTGDGTNAGIKESNRILSVISWEASR